MRHIDLSTTMAETLLSLDELCRATTVHPQWVLERIGSGLLAPARADADSWLFETVAVERVRSMVRLERDFDAAPELAALVADLESEIRRLRTRLRRLDRA
ncbi:MAG: chaperone modulator CbpM [Aquabacterium sp.]